MPALKALAARLRGKKPEQRLPHDSYRLSLFHRKPGRNPAQSDAIPSLNPISVLTGPEIDQVLIEEAKVWQQSLTNAQAELSAMDRTLETFLTDMRGLGDDLDMSGRKGSGQTVYETARQLLEDVLPDAEHERASAPERFPSIALTERDVSRLADKETNASNPYLRGDDIRLPRISSIDWSEVNEQHSRWLAEAYDKERTSRHDGRTSLPGAPNQINEPRHGWEGKGKAKMVEDDLDDVWDVVGNAQAAIRHINSGVRLCQERDQPVKSPRAPHFRGPSLPEQPSTPLRDCAVCGDQKPVLEFPPIAPSASVSYTHLTLPTKRIV